MLKDSKLGILDKKGYGGDGTMGDEPSANPPYDKYTLMEKLGEGTYGIVYKGQHKETGEVSLV